MLPQPILFYDGNCALCNNFVNLILKIGTNPPYYFAPLTGNTAQIFLPESFKNKNFDAIVLWKNKQFYSHQEAVFQIIKSMPIGIRVLLIFNIIPNFILRKLYQFVAKNRFTWNPRLEACPIPPDKYKNQFIFD